MEIVENQENVENSQNIENSRNNEENMMALITPIFGLIILPVCLIIGFTLHAASIQLSFSRLLWLLKDSYEIIVSVFMVLVFYIRNPHLRIYILRNILSSSSVQPQQSHQIEIELQTI